MPTPPSYQKVNPADQPILFIALKSPTLPLYRLNEYAETLMAQRISMVSGVAQVQIYGAQKYAVRIQLDPRALASRGIGIDQVASAVAANNVNLPTGILWGREKAFTVKATGQLNAADEYRPIVVAYRNGAPVRLQDLGSVFDSVQNDKVAAWFNDSRCILLAIQRQPGTNTVQVSNAVKDLLPSFKNQLPASAELHILFDKAEPIQESVNDVQVHAAADPLPRHPGHFPLPAQRLGHGDPEPRPARCRWWARSRSWRCSASTSTTSR